MGKGIVVTIVVVPWPLSSILNCFRVVSVAGDVSDGVKNDTPTACGLNRGIGRPYGKPVAAEAVVWVAEGPEGDSLGLKGKVNVRRV